MKVNELLDNLKIGDINNVQQNIESTYGDLGIWCKEEYNENFSEYFKDIKEIHDKLYSESRPIDDSELEEILTTVPLNLFSVSEMLSIYKLKRDSVKSEMKRVKYSISVSDEFKDLTKEKIKEAGDIACINYEILVKGYDCIIDRVEHEMSYSKELVMAAKKLWASRQQAVEDSRYLESKIDNQELPDYRQEYIR